MCQKALILLTGNFEKLTFDQALLSFRAVNRLRGKRETRETERSTESGFDSSED